MNAALWAIAVSVVLLGIAVALVGLVLTQIARSVQAMASQVGLRREAQDQRIDELETLLRVHIDAPRHTHTPKRRKKAEQPTLTQS